MHDPIAPPGRRVSIQWIGLSLRSPGPPIGSVHLHHLHSGFPEVACEADPIGAGALDADPVKNAMPTHPLQQGSIPRW